MTERFVAERGEVWDQTTEPRRKLHLDDARAMVRTWHHEAGICRQRGAYETAKLWSGPASRLTIAIEAAIAQRRMMGSAFRESSQ